MPSERGKRSSTSIVHRLKRRTNPILEEDDDTLILIVDCQPNSHRFLNIPKPFDLFPPSDHNHIKQNPGPAVASSVFFKLYTASSENECKHITLIKQNKPHHHHTNTISPPHFNFLLTTTYVIRRIQPEQRRSTKFSLCCKKYCSKKTNGLKTINS